MYCILCQEEHVTEVKCFVNVECKGCGQRGHIKKDCSRGEQRKLRSHRSESNQGRKAVRVIHFGDIDTPIVKDLSCFSVVNICKDKIIDTEVKQNVKSKEESVNGTDNVGTKRDNSYDENLAAAIEYYEEFAAVGDLPSDASLSLSLKEEEGGIIHISDDDHEGNNGCNNNVSTFDIFLCLAADGI